jgi:hypothetical protein
MCVLAVVAGAGFWWWPHLYWSFIMARNQVRVPSMPITELKAPGKTTGWYDCSIGPLKLKLPPDIVEKAERSVGKTSLNFTTANRELDIHIPFQIGPDFQPEQSRMAADFNLSPMHLIVECFRASTDDFHWSMSRSALRKHEALLQMGSYFRRGGVMAVETRFDGPLEGLLIFHTRRQASFEWRTPGGAGSVLFADKDQDLDRDMLRDICQSLACDDSRLAASYSKVQLKDFLETMETARDESDTGKK